MAENTKGRASDIGMNFQQDFQQDFRSLKLPVDSQKIPIDANLSFHSEKHSTEFDRPLIQAWILVSWWIDLPQRLELGFPKIDM